MLQDIFFVSMFLLFDIGLIGSWSSILGFLIGIATLIVTGCISRAVGIANKKAIYNSLSIALLEKLKNCNSDYLQCITKRDNRGIRSSLNSIRIQLTIIERSIPKDYKKNCSSLIKQVKKQYHTRFENEVGGIGFFAFKQVSHNQLWDTYDKVTELIDYLEYYQEEKKVIS